MDSHVFLQSDTQDPYTIYHDRLSAQPVFWDAQNRLWVLYSYPLCCEIFMHPHAHIPPVSTEGLNEYALAIVSRLVRISNAPTHAAAKQAALLLFRNMRAPRVRDSMAALIPAQAEGLEIDWVDSVGRKLPVLHLLQGFGIDREESIFIAANMNALLTIMQPVKTSEQAAIINAIAKDIYMLLEAQLLRAGFIKEVIQALVSTHAVSKEEALALCVSNLAGLLIQSYDASRGLLSNALLHFLRDEETLLPANSHAMEECMIEIARFNPPVHNTRRLAVEDIPIDGHTIEKGQTILLMTAAANRDAQQFKAPEKFDTARPNNNLHLGFGLGAHMCVAKTFSTRMAGEAVSFLFDSYARVRLTEKNIQYEPLVNLRLPRHVFIACSK